MRLELAISCGLAVAEVLGATRAGASPALRMRDIDLQLPTHGAIPSAGITVVLDRHGELAPDGFHVVLPEFGGGDRVWREVVTCVRARFAPFRIDIATAAPDHGPFIHVIFGGRASMVNLDDATTNGIGSFSGDVLPSATAHVFSQSGSGERDIGNLCHVAAHEIGHTLGLDHSMQCGDIMSYCDRSNTNTQFLDLTSRCGETNARDCAYGAPTQSSYRRLAAHLGLRHELVPIDPYFDPRAPVNPY